MVPLRILQLVSNRSANGEDSCSTLMYMLTTPSVLPPFYLPLTSISGSVQPFSTPSDWELSVAVRTESPFYFGQKRHELKFGPALAERVVVPKFGAVRSGPARPGVVVTVPKQVPPVMIAAYVALKVAGKRNHYAKVCVSGTHEILSRQ
jgi:hypothetical protein